MSEKKTLEQLIGEFGVLCDQAAQSIFAITAEKKYTVVYTCAQCGRHFSCPVSPDHHCVTIIETTARDVTPKPLLLPEGDA